MSNAGKTKTFRNSLEEQMETQKNSLATLSPTQTSKQPVSSSEAIRQFLVMAGEVYGEQITAPLVSIWIEELSAHPPEMLEHLFRNALHNRKFFPTIAEILEPLKAVKKAALPEEASNAWQEVLAIRRQHYNADFPRYLASAMEELPERVQRAARARTGRLFRSKVSPRSSPKGQEISRNCVEANSAHR
jgi:hypothetical protein